MTKQATKRDLFHRADGQLTAYALLCGYQQQYFNGEKYHTSTLTVELYMEHSHYHVRAFNEDAREPEWFGKMQEAAKKHPVLLSYFRNRENPTEVSQEWNAENGWRTWETFDNLSEARKAFAFYKRKMKTIAKAMK